MPPGTAIAPSKIASPDGLTVGYDAGPLLDPPTGIGRYTSELSKALEIRGVKLRRYAVAWGGKPPAEVRRIRMPARLAHMTWRVLGRPSVERATGEVDLVHATNFVLPPTKAPGVVTIHDLTFLRDDVYPGGQRLRELVPESLKRAARVITPSAAIADELAERCDYPRDRISVTHEGVSEEFFAASPLSDTALGRMGIPGRFVVAVGTIEPRKNLPTLLSAWRKARLDGYTLVIAGPKGWGPGLPETPGVVLTGWVGDSILPGLYAAADAFCYPSLYEGFGLPPVEAMAAGTPVVAGAYSAATEILGSAALIVDPSDADALAGALHRVLSDDATRAQLRLAGRARAAAYTWDATGKATISCYRSVIQG
jgi:glycosyltransferase involved in cell wall biosynthesis